MAASWTYSRLAAGDRSYSTVSGSGTQNTWLWNAGRPWSDSFFFQIVERSTTLRRVITFFTVTLRHDDSATARDMFGSLPLWVLGCFG